jgi:hypothetical protein
MLLAQLTVLLFFHTLPPQPPVLPPLRVLATNVSVTSNTQIPTSVSISSPIQGIGTSSWLGNFLSLNGIYAGDSTAAPASAAVVQ